MKKKLLGKTPEELRQIAVECGLPPYAGNQIAQGLYRKRVRSIAVQEEDKDSGRDDEPVQGRTCPAVGEI